jgi:hypothetical protein
VKERKDDGESDVRMRRVGIWWGMGGAQTLCGGAAAFADGERRKSWRWDVLELGLADPLYISSSPPTVHLQELLKG